MVFAGAAARVEQAGVPAVHISASTGDGIDLLRHFAGGRWPRPCIAEMGGKNAIIVDDTADLDEAVTGVVQSRTGYAGQKCSACSRVILLDSIHDAFIQRLADAVMSLRIGAAEDPATQVGPVIDGRAQKRIRDYLEIGRREGRVVVDRSMEGAGYAVGPVVIADIEPAHRLAQEEIFGPVLAVMRASSFEQALQLANGTAYAWGDNFYGQLGNGTSGISVFSTTPLPVSSTGPGGVALTAIAAGAVHTCALAEGTAAAPSCAS